MKIKTIATLALAALLLVSCGGNGDAQETTVPAETTAPVTEATEATLTLVSGGEAIYTLVRADETEDEGFIDVFKRAADKLKGKTGLAFRLGNDWIKRGSTPDPALPEILLGRTNRPESAAVAARVGRGGSAVAIEGQKVVIYGTGRDALTRAVNTFIDALTVEGDTVTLTLPVGGIIEGTTDLFFENGRAEDYVIVAAEQDKAAAETLADAFEDAFGYKPAVNDAKSASAAREIVVGDCGRSEVSALFDSLPSPVAYTMTVSDEKLILGGGTAFANVQAVNRFIEQFANEAYHAALHVPTDLKEIESAMVNAKYVERTEGSDLRIMSFNILSQEWNDKIPISGRDAIVGAALFTYMPDVIGWQELSDAWYRALDNMIEDEYTFVNRNTAEGAGNYTGMSYNPKTVKLIESGCELFSKGNSPRLRLMNWGLFEKLEGGKRFIVMNTHLDITQDKRLVQAPEMAARVKSLGEKYNCPVIITGDYNCNKNSQEYGIFVKGAEVKDAQWTAKTTVNADYTSTHKVYSSSGKGDTAIDHITYTTGVAPLFYYNNNSVPTINASDHNPLLVDFKLD